MLSRFFIERPIFANVIAILTIVFGGIAVFALPIELYPQITPPTVVVSANYPGASAKVVADTVAAPIEQQVNGVENMIYMSSTSSSDGSYALTVTFDVGTNVDMAQVLVQNRVQIALPQVPQEVQRQGIVTKKQATDIIMFVTLTSPDKRFDSLYLSNYAIIYIRDELARLHGVGDITVVGTANYSMRMWLNPDELATRGLTTQDVINAVQEQNLQVAAGQVGQPPAPPNQRYQYTVTTLGRLTDPEEFGNIVVKSGQGLAPEIVRVKDVARVELGAQTYDQYFQVNGVPAAGMAVFQLPGANALDVATRIRAKMEALKQHFPQGIEYRVPFDTTKFVTASIHEVYWTLIEAGAMVLIVILVFLQDWRAVLVPATTVPVTIIGAFAAMYALGFTVNMLTLFGLVLAIGIVVDDAIVIVENASRHIEGGMTPKEGTIQAMGELLGPIIGITLVLCSVFLPAAFFGGITGQLYRQFALTIAATALISAINALTLKPAQCAVYLRSPTGRRQFIFFRAFNAFYRRCEHYYSRIVAWIVHHPFKLMGVYAILAGAAAWGFLRLPTGFLPVEDQGYFIISVQLPDAASQARTKAVVDKLNDSLRAVPGIQNVNGIVGRNVFENTICSNTAACYITFKPWDERRERGQSMGAILGRLRREFRRRSDAILIAFPPPAIRGLGVSGGFQMEVQDRGGLGLHKLDQIARDLITTGNSRPDLRSLTTTFSANVPQIHLNIDRTKVKALDVPLDALFNTLQTFLGSTYVNDFNAFGRTYQVRLQAEARFRYEIDDVLHLYVRNTGGQMVELGTLMSIEWQPGAQTITRYNLYPAASITGLAAPGYSSGQALTTMEQMADQKLPQGMDYEWTAMSYQEKLVGHQAVFVFGLAVLLVYLVLAAQYESWSSPAAVILVVPTALLGTVIAVALRGLDNNIYTQIGIVLIIALASKNAILIVEFARHLHSQGMSIADAAAEAARRRFRPIVMTSFAFILGVSPLVVAEGAGASGRQALGTAVFGGMIASTVLAVFFVPVFFVLCQRFSEWRSTPRRAGQ
ncbi:MAG TPA: multidrug efflux RND transporter permease subunit [Phycisphaerae bacterium]|nr:multidrug efflux RND transporter permease subunit [Phycisphaerae bacterium]